MAEETIVSEVEEKKKKGNKIEIDPIEDYFKSYDKEATVEVIENKDDSESSKESEKPKRKRRSTRKKKMIVSGEILTGALFLTIVDMLLPMLIATVNNYVSKKGKIDATSLQLTRDQQKQLEPIADEVMKEIEMNANPIAIMVISMAGIYGMNFMAAKLNVNGL